MTVWYQAQHLDVGFYDALLPARGAARARPRRTCSASTALPDSSWHGPRETRAPPRATVPAWDSPRCSTSSRPPAARSAATAGPSSASPAARSCRASARRSACAAGGRTVHPVERCRDCAGRRPAYATARAALVLDDHVGRLVRAWKDRGLGDLGARARRRARWPRCRRWPTGRRGAGAGGRRPGALARRRRPGGARARCSPRRGSMPLDERPAGARPAAGAARPERRRAPAQRPPGLRRARAGAPRRVRAGRRRAHHRRDGRRVRAARCGAAGAERVDVVTVARVVR